MTNRLEACDHTYWVDWQDILPLSEWRQEIRQGILDSNNFLFVMSPASLVSKECLKELEYAISFNKRLIPILCQKTSGCKVPASLSSINWISFIGDHSFEQSFQELLLAFDRDLDYVKAHTRLLKLADEWVHHQRDNSFLLRGSNLESVETWLYQKSNLSPALTQLQRDFVATSRVAETHRQKRDMRNQRIVLGSAIVALTIVSALGLLAETRKREAISQEITALNYASIASLALKTPFESLQQGLRATLQLQKSKWIRGPLRAETLSALAQAVYRVQERNVVEGHSDWVYGVEFSPDGKLLASASLDGSVKLWQPDGILINTFQGPDGGGLADVSFSPDGQTLAAGGEDTVYLWSTAGELLRTLQGHGDWVSSVRFSPDGQKIASASADKTVRIWRQDGTSLATLTGHAGPVTSVSFNPVTDTLVSGGFDSTIRVWQTNGTLLKTIETEDGILDVAFSPDGAAIAAASKDGTVTLWSPEGNLLSRLQPIANGALSSVKFSPDGQFIVAAGQDRIVRVWRRDGTLVTSLPGHQDYINHVAFSPNGTTIVSASDDLSIRLWQWDNPWIEQLKSHSDSINDVGINPQTGQIISGSQDGTLKLWSPQGEVIKTLEATSDRINNVAVSPDGRWIAAVGQESIASQIGLVQLWSGTGEARGVIGRQGKSINAVAFSPNSQSIASASDDGLIQIRGLDGQIQQTFELGANASVVEFSPDGQFLAAGGVRAFKVWRLAEAELIHTYESANTVYDLSFNPDSQILVFANSDRTIGLWPLNEPAPRFLEKSHEGEVYAVQFSPDGRQFASAGQDSTLRLWSSQGEAIATIGNHDASIRTLQFNVDGSKVITGSDDNTLIIWDLSILSLEKLVPWSCSWLTGYLQNNPNVADSDRNLCQGITPWSLETTGPALQ
ncbi:TIR domain-containing protein [Leptolyngbya subtilissima DQ-A4]|uniref:TIR domain-containing protein n=1 Tax=Leptolyngbya subtilissima DQ-A4 TaxID=2933933 RepID=A0ABV0K958_9CYAN